MTSSVDDEKENGMAYATPWPGFTIPGVGDIIGGVEATIGNVIEGIIEGVSGQKVELTPGTGVDNTRATGARGSGDVKFDKKLASHDDVERMRKETQRHIEQLNKEIARMRAKEAAREAARRQIPNGPIIPGAPVGTFPGPGTYTQSVPGYPGTYAPSAPMGNNLLSNPLMLLLLLGNQGAGGGSGRGLFSNPLMLFLLMGQSTTMPIGAVGGAPVSLDLAQLMLMQLMMSSLNASLLPAAPASTVV